MLFAVIAKAVAPASVPIFDCRLCSNPRWYVCNSLFLEHVHRVASYVVNKKGMIPIIWDDMLRKIQSEKLIESGIGRLVEPMVWVYVEDIDRFIYSFTWSTYAEVFPHIWTASAYKGAFGEQLYIVNVARHVYNNLAWLDVMKRETLGPEKVVSF